LRKREYSFKWSCIELRRINRYLKKGCGSFKEVIREIRVTDKVKLGVGSKIRDRVTLKGRII
jgi:hypothetical protein